MANRFAYGYTPTLGRQIRAAGAPSAWFNKQLNPCAIADTRADTFASWFRTIGFTAAEHCAHQQDDPT